MNTFTRTIITIGNWADAHPWTFMVTTLLVDTLVLFVGFAVGNWSINGIAKGFGAALLTSVLISTPSYYAMMKLTS